MYNGFKDASDRLSQNKIKVEGRFLELQNQKVQRYQSLLNERRIIHEQMHKMPTIRVLESIKNRKTKLDILKPLTSGNKNKAMFNESLSPRQLAQRNKIISEKMSQNPNYSYASSNSNQIGNVTIMNYKNLDELNEAFFSHKKEKPDNSAVISSRTKKNHRRDNSLIANYADQSIGSNDKHTSRMGNSSGKYL